MDAIEQLAELTNQDPRLSKARLVLGDIYRKVGRVDLARAEYTAGV